MKASTLAISLFLSTISSNNNSFCSAFSTSSSSSLSIQPRTTTQLFQQTVETSTNNNNEAAPAVVDNTPNWETKQHLYGLDMQTDTNNSNSAGSVTIGADGNEVTPGTGSDESLPLPDTYITCGKCKSLFAIDESDLGTRGKGCRVKCSVCDNSWYQSRDRLLNIPTETHALLPSPQSNLDRIANNLAKDLDPSYMGTNKLYVGNLDFRTGADDLKAFFESNGCEQVCDVSVITGPEGRSRGFAFVTFYDKEDGEKALECNGMECNGRQLAVREPNN